MLLVSLFNFRKIPAHMQEMKNVWRCIREKETREEGAGEGRGRRGRGGTDSGGLGHRGGCSTGKSSIIFRF